MDKATRLATSICRNRNANTKHKQHKHKGHNMKADKTIKLATSIAEATSRRAFLQRLGHLAAGTALALGGLLAATAHAAPGGPYCNGPLASSACLGKKQGEKCQVGFYSGRCKGAPDCYCAIKAPPH